MGLLYSKGHFRCRLFLDLGMDVYAVAPPGILSLHEELGCAVYAEVVIRTKGRFEERSTVTSRSCGGLWALVAMPPEGLEEGIEEIGPDLCSGMVFGEGEVLVLFELLD